MDVTALLIEELKRNNEVCTEASKSARSLEGEIRTFKETVEIWLERSDKQQQEHIKFLQNQTSSLIKFQQKVTIEILKWGLAIAGWVVAGAGWTNVMGWW